MGARREVVSAVAERYQSARRTEKGRILDELCATTGWHRKHAMRALRRHETPNGISPCLATTIAPLPEAVDGSGYAWPDPPTASPAEQVLEVDRLH
jgi:hypothetical protein